MAWALFGLATLRVYRYVEVLGTSFARLQSILGGNDQWLESVRRARVRPAEHPPLTMLRVLRSVQGFEATDPRDMVYAFLALAVDGAHPDLRPDYGCAVPEVYRRFAVHLVACSRNLDVLGHCQDVETPVPGKVAAFAAVMPSWVPDWTSQPVRPLPKRSWTAGVGHRALYNACGGHNDANAEFDGPVMAVQGFVVDCVEEVAPRRNYEKLGHLEEDWPLAKAWTDVGVRNTPDALYPGPWMAGEGGRLNRLDAFRHTLCADLSSEQEPERGHTSSWPIQEILTAGDAAPVDTFVGDFCADIVTRRRRLFRTARGYVGLSAGSVKAGDEMCVLFGSLVPIVLRREGRSWRVVGECYVHGIMDGEVLKLGLPVTNFKIV
jgi:hypothetical protein